MSDQPAEIRHRIGRDGTFTLRTLSGSVRIRGADTDEAVVVARNGRGSPARVNVERSAGRLAIELPRINASFFGRGFGGRDTEVEFEVELPRGSALNVAGISADVVVADMHGGQAYKSVSGDLALSGVGGPISIRSVSGDVSIARAGSIGLEIVTTSGDVEVEADRIEQLSVRSVSGDVDIDATLLPGPRHAVETVSGDLRLRSGGGVTVQPARALDIGRAGRRQIVVGDGAAHLSFRSMSGEERVVDGRVDAEVRSRETTASGATSTPTEPVDKTTSPDRLEILRSLERGDIDVEQAYRQLEEVSSDA